VSTTEITGTTGMIDYCTKENVPQFAVYRPCCEEQVFLVAKPSHYTALFAEQLHEVW